MTFQLTVRDQDTFQRTHKDVEFVVYLPEARISVRELIRQRVCQEVATYNDQHGDIFYGLVQPGDAERTLNGYRLSKRRLLNAEDQVQKATHAFESNGFIVLVDDRQAESLDQVIELTPESQVTFLKLVPLVGG
jgi:hypothetical protein